jgi:hypothetical protein
VVIRRDELSHVVSALLLAMRHPRIERSEPQ